MATTDSRPDPDPREAAADLRAADAAERAVRDRPWPVWLYPLNALLLGGLAMAALIDSSMLAAFIVVGLGVTLAGSNYSAGVAMGTPFAVPTSRAFRVLVALSSLFLLGAVLAHSFEHDGAIIACAIGATLSYAIGSVVHYRSTH